MYPYYGNETNDNLKEIFTVLGEQYKNHNAKRRKQDLFDRITEIYVSKQMTLNNITNMRKKDIIDSIYKSIDSNMNLYDSNMFLIGGIS